MTGMPRPRTAEEKRDAWGDGPWVDEPNRVAFESHGLHCILLRHSLSGHWCGYVGLPPGHPLHRREWLEDDFDVHGEISYFEPCDGDPVNGVCHVPQPGESDDLWWIGFACAGPVDYQPGIEAVHLEMARQTAGYAELFGKVTEKKEDLYAEFPQLRPVYRTVDYVREQTEGLARQLAASRGGDVEVDT